MAEWMSSPEEQSGEERDPQVEGVMERVRESERGESDSPHPDPKPSYTPALGSQGNTETGVGFSTSCLTTAELQQHWRAVRQQRAALWLLFEIPSARTVEQPASRHVVYQVVVIRSGSFDCDRVVVQRRYSDFVRLHRLLLLDFSDELEEIALPRKRFLGNFSEENIAERRVALRDYLTALYSVRCIRKCPTFQNFFTHPELKAAYDLLRGGQFDLALQLLQDALMLQEKLAGHDPSVVVPTLCALLVCHRDLRDLHAAFQMGQRALPMVRRYGLDRYRCSLLEALVDLGYRLDKPVAQLQEELVRQKESPGRGGEPLMTLKELVVREFT